MFLKLDCALMQHPKLLRLCRKLDVSRPAAIGHLALLWGWCMAYAPSGELSPFDRAEIAEAACWPGDPDAFVQALVDCRFLDNDDCLAIHDWRSHGGSLFAEREAHAERQAAYRERKKRDGHVTVT